MFTGLETPVIVKVKARLIEEGKYVPVVKKGSVEASIRRGTDLMQMGLLDEGGRIDDLYNEEGDSTVLLAGKAVMDGYVFYLKVCARELDSMQQDEHELYECWYKVSHLTF